MDPDPFVVKERVNKTINEEKSNLRPADENYPRHERGDSLLEEDNKLSKVNPTNGENKKRGYVIQEIIATEATYLERLKFAIEYVIKPMKEAKILSEEDVVKQFNFLESIYDLHNEHRIDGSASQNLKFIELFDAIGRNVQCYSDYLVNYEPAMQRRAHLLIYNRKFADFIEKVEKDPHLQNQKIESLLILPVQRVPRYRLLLEQLLKYTPQDHVDYTVVKNALDNICALAMYNNEAIRARENKSKMMEIMLSIEPTSRMDLLAEERRFLKEAALLKQCRRRYKEFHFWLFSDQLLYGEMTPIGLYTLNRQIPLARCKVSNLEDGDPEAKTSFIIESPAKSFKIKAKDEVEQRDWLEAVRDAVEKQKALNKNDKDAVAPVWRPDTKSENCELCDTYFTLIFRRHHCRNCGSLVCDNCSSKRFHLPHVEERKLVRVCDTCYETLNPSDNLNQNTKPLSMIVAVNESPDESEDEELLRYRRDVVSEENLNDFNEFLEKNADKFSIDTDVALPENVVKSVQRMTPPPKPPRTNRATYTNLSSDGLTALQSQQNPPLRQARATVVTRAPTTRRAPRKSLLDSITTSVLKPTGLLQTLVGNALGESASETKTSPERSNDNIQTSGPNLFKTIAPSATVQNPNPPKAVTTTGQQESTFANVAIDDYDSLSPRKPRRTNVFLKPNPLLAELTAKIEKDVKQKSDV